MSTPIPPPPARPTTPTQPGDTRCFEAAATPAGGPAAGTDSVVPPPDAGGRIGSGAAPVGALPAAAPTAAPVGAGGLPAAASHDGTAHLPSSRAGPQRIVCLTEETTEWLYLLGEDARIVGISGYTVRPRRARTEKPRVSAFLDGKIDKIVALQPDLVIGFSDMQAALADKLIRAGLNVFITNQRSVGEIFATLQLVAGLVGAHDRAAAWIAGCRARHAEIAAAAAAWPRRPRVYFEEWDVPMISAIRWVSELVALAGGDDVFAELGLQPMGRDRVVADAQEPVRRAPDIVVGSWCGKKFRPDAVAARPGWADVPAVRGRQLHEIKSCDVLQPGPAALTDGLEQLHRLFARWAAGG